MTWLYHGTTMENLPTIIKHGLLPAKSGEYIRRSWEPRKYHRTGLFLAYSEEEAVSWAWGRENSMNRLFSDTLLIGPHEFTAVVLRVDIRHVPGATPDTLSKGNGVITYGEIPPQYLQIRAGAPYEHGPWESLATWARSG